MSIRSLYPAALTTALAAALLAVPACNRQGDDAPGGPEPNPEPWGQPLTPVGKVQLAAARMKSQNNLKQIAVGFHNYHDSMGYMPAGIYGPDGKTVGLSWRVQILPYIGEDWLYRQFRTSEAWDSPHNKALIDRMPAVYQAPGEQFNRPGMTYYRAFAGPHAATPLPLPSDRGTPGGPVRGRTLSGFTDGTSNTGLVAEALEPVVWTKPDELVYDPKGPLPKLGGIFSTGTNIVLGDGSVRFFSADTPASVLPALITHAGGEVVNFP